MLYSLHSRYSRQKMKVLLQFRFVGDTTEKKKKKGRSSLLRGIRTFGGAEGGAVVALVQQKFTLSYAPRKWGVYLE